MTAILTSIGVVIFRLSTSAERAVAPTVASRRPSAIVKQRSPDGMPIAVGDRMRLLVGPNLELPALQLTVVVTAADVS